MSCAQNRSRGNASTHDTPGKATEHHRAADPECLHLVGVDHEALDRPDASRVGRTTIDLVDLVRLGPRRLRTRNSTDPLTRRRHVLPVGEEERHIAQHLTGKGGIDPIQVGKLLGRESPWARGSQWVSPVIDQWRKATPLALVVAPSPE